MAELSSMPLLDENQNTSTLNNRVPESDDILLTSTNNGGKNITSECTSRNPTSVKGNFSEANSNITVLSVKNLNILAAETEGSFVKLEVGPVQDFSNVSIVGETENSFRTANGSILGENNSFRSLDGSNLEETAESPSNFAKSTSDDTVIKFGSPTLCISANTSLHGTEGLGISSNDASSPTFKSSFNEVNPNSSVTKLINDLSTITSPMGNNSSSPERKSDSSFKSNLSSTVELPSVNKTFTEGKPDISPRSVLDTTSTLEAISSNQTSFTEDKFDTSVKIPLASASFVELPSDNQASFTQSKANTPVKSPLSTSALELCAVTQTSFTEDKPGPSVKNHLNISTLESSVVNQISFTAVDPDSSVKNLSTLELSTVSQTSFTEDKSDTSVKDISTLELPAANQTSVADDKPGTSVENLLCTSTLESSGVNQTSFIAVNPDISVKNLSTLESLAVNQTSFTEDKSDTSVKDLSTLELSVANQTSVTDDKSGTSVENLLSTATLESCGVNQTSFTAVNLDSSVKNLSSLESPAAIQISFIEDKSDTSINSLVGISKLELPVSKQTSSEVNPDTSVKNLSTLESPTNHPAQFTEDKSDNPVKKNSESLSESPVDNHVSFNKEKPDIPVEYALEGGSVVLPLSSQLSLTDQKLNTPVHSLLETTSSAELLIKNVFTEDKSDNSVETLLNTTATVVLPLPLCDSSISVNKRETKGNSEVDISINANSLPNKSASFTADNAAESNILLSNQETKTNFSNDLNSALDQAFDQDCSFTADSVFTNSSEPAGSSSTPDQNNRNFENAYQELNQPTGTPINSLSNAFNDGLHEEKISLPDDPFGMCQPDLFDLMGVEENANPKEDFVFKVPDNPVNVENEEFTDAVQFFKDPSSFQFLESIKTSQTETNLPRSSLYIKFDPLHSKFPSQSSNILQALKNEANLDPNKQLHLSARESLGNILISFDSPRKADCCDAQTPIITTPVKVYTEEELQQHLKVNELTNQEMLLKKQREMEKELVRKEKEMMMKAEEKDQNIAQMEKLLKVQRGCLEELALASSTMLEKNKDSVKKMQAIEEENVKLKGDVKTLTDDLQSVETTFADFHKRYEQCKGMLKTYKDNEELLRTKLKEQDQAYQVLQDRMRESSENASSEISSIKKGSEAQIAVLSAQLKKANLKISSLESDLKQIRIENNQLGGICDDLMEKVGKT